MTVKNLVKYPFRLVRSSLREHSFPFPRYMNENKCIFIHVPKTAGTSVLAMFGVENEGRLHLPWYVFQSANPTKFDKFYKFAFVRNPWCRVWSAYKYLCAGGNKVGDLDVSREILRYRDFNDFVVRGLGTGAFRSHILFIPQSYFIAGPSGTIMVDYVGFVESFSADLSVLREKMGLSTDKPNCTLNSSYAMAHPELTEEGVEIVQSIYRQDIYAFQYSFSDSIVKLSV